MSPTLKNFTSNEIKPLGWLKRQLEIQAKGLCGNLDLIWADIRESAWIGGNRDGWERVPYWLDGFIPLAYLLENADMISRAKRFIDKILENQKEDGWICPSDNVDREKYDNWATQLVTKTLTVYYECSKDERVPPVLYLTLKNYYEQLAREEITLFNWAKYRWFETFVGLNFLNKYYPDEKWIADFARLLKNQGIDYTELTGLWQKPLNKWTYNTHIVNIVMALKFEAISHVLLGESYSDKAEELYAVLDKYNGTAVGTFTGDECLSGISPIQGTELCSVVEQMYSYEILYAVTGDKKWAERLELVAFNALPATLDDQTNAHQYVQMVNQIDCTPFGGKPVFRTNGREAHMFGLEPHFGCCTANFGQGWPKFALCAFMQNERGIESSVPVPSSLRSEWNGIPYEIRLETEYPFKNSFKYTVKAEKPLAMNLRIRIPSFAKNLTVNGIKIAARDYFVLDSIDEGETVINLNYDVDIRIEDRPLGMSVMRRGSLVFSLPLDCKIEVKENPNASTPKKFPFCDYHYSSDSAWNYAFTGEETRLFENETAEIPFSSKNPPLEIYTDLLPIDWGFEEGYETVCRKTPQSPTAVGPKETKRLVPYGCAKLRMTEMPLIK